MMPRPRPLLLLAQRPRKLRQGVRLLQRRVPPHERRCLLVLALLLDEVCEVCVGV